MPIMSEFRRMKNMLAPPEDFPLSWEKGVNYWNSAKMMGWQGEEVGEKKEAKVSF